MSPLTSPPAPGLLNSATSPCRPDCHCPKSPAQHAQHNIWSDDGANGDWHHHWCEGRDYSGNVLERW